MAEIRIDIDGVGQVVIDLREVVNELADLQVMQKLAADASRIMASLVPVDTGRLAASVRGSKSKNRAVVRVGNKRSVPYSGPINYGWPRRNITASGFLARTDQIIGPRVKPTIEMAITRIIRQKGLT